MKTMDTWEHFPLEIKVTITCFKKAKTLLTSLSEPEYWTWSMVQCNTSTGSRSPNHQNKAMKTKEQKTPSFKEKRIFHLWPIKMCFYNEKVPVLIFLKKPFNISLWEHQSTTLLCIKSTQGTRWRQSVHHKGI